jgi:uncharacterized caspase-like protein
MTTTSESTTSHIHPRRALVIGNNSYTKNPLNNCVNDANDLTDKLRALRFQVDKGINCTRKKMVSLIREFSDSIENQDLVLFFFVGHGVQYKERNYLLPVEADEEIKGEEDIEPTSINAQNTSDRLAHKTSYITIFILDCCRSYRVPSKGRSQSSENRAPGLNAMISPWGTLLLFAGGPGSDANDGDTGDRNGLYTKHLLKHIDTPNMDLELILKIVHNGVFLESDRKQMPQYVSTIMIPEPIYLNKQDPDKTSISGNTCTMHILLTNERCS